MEKTGYQQTIQRADLKRNAEVVNFFKSIPFIAHVPRSKIGKLPLNMSEDTYGKDQVVLREGEQAEIIVIIKSGAFELTKSFNKEDQATVVRRVGLQA
jgi:CRP-like cAMP-binding protein